MRYLLLGLATVLCLNDATAQHYNTWLRTTLQVPINDKWETSGEIQGRRQNSFAHTNPLSEHLLYSYRHWVNYEHSESIRFSISPFAYYRSYKAIVDESDRALKPTTEYRFTLAMAMQHSLYKTLYVTDRTALAYRMFEDRDNLARLRNRLGLRYDLKSHWTFDLYHELFLNANSLPDSYFDHERLGMLAAYKFSDHFSMQVGYIHITRMHDAMEELREESNIIMNLSYCLEKHHHRHPSKIN